jgi:hypothetical protein
MEAPCFWAVVEQEVDIQQVLLQVHHLMVVVQVLLLRSQPQVVTVHQIQVVEVVVAQVIMVQEARVAQALSVSPSLHPNLWLPAVV